MLSNVDIVHVLVRVTSTAVGTPPTLSTPSYQRSLQGRIPPRGPRHGRPRRLSGVPRPPPVPPVPQLEPIDILLGDEHDELALVVDTGMASVKVRALELLLCIHVRTHMYTSTLVHCTCTHVHVLSKSNMYCDIVRISSNTMLTGLLYKCYM